MMQLEQDNQRAREIKSALAAADFLRSSYPATRIDPEVWRFSRQQIAELFVKLPVSKHKKTIKRIRRHTGDRFPTVEQVEQAVKAMLKEGELQLHLYRARGVTADESGRPTKPLPAKFQSAVDDWTRRPPNMTNPEERKAAFERLGELCSEIGNEWQIKRRRPRKKAW